MTESLRASALFCDEHVGQQRDEAAGDVGEGDGEGGAVGAVGGGFFEAEFEAHHEVDPGGGVLFERCEDGIGAVRSTEYCSKIS